MAVRAYLRSPAALLWTAVGLVAVGAVLGAGWLAAAAAGVGDLGTAPVSASGLTEVLFLAVLVAVGALVSLVWTPVGAGIAYAVGRRVRGDPASFRESVAAVRTSGVALLRWLKTRVATGPLADRVLGEDDVAPNEVAAGCGKFVVAALLLDAPGALPRAVERANRVTPRPGHERVLAGGLAGTGVLAAAVVAGGLQAPDAFGDAAPALAALAVLLGGVLTAALSAAWRATVYASQDLSEGFAR